MTENRTQPRKNLARARTVHELAQRLEKMQAARHLRRCEEVLPSGIPALDHLLPQGGFRRNSLVEWLGESAASGVDLLALLSVRSLLKDRGTLVVLDRDQTFYPPAVIALKIAPRQLIVVRPKNQAEELWALEQCLQSAGVTAVLCRLERVASRMLRRMQLAIERGGGLGFLLRPLSARGQPAWSDVRLLVNSLTFPAPRRRWCVELVRCRRGAGEKTVILELDDATGLVSPVAELVPAVRAAKSSSA